MANVAPTTQSSKSTTVEVITGSDVKQIQLPREPKKGEAVVIAGDKTSYVKVQKNNLGLQSH